MHIFAIEYVSCYFCSLLFGPHNSFTHNSGRDRQERVCVCKYFIIQAHNLTIWALLGFLKNIINIYFNSICLHVHTHMCDTNVESKCAFSDIVEKYKIFLSDIIQKMKKRASTFVSNNYSPLFTFCFVSFWIFFKTIFFFSLNNIASLDVVMYCI